MIDILYFIGGYLLIGLVILVVLGLLLAAWERIGAGWPGNF